MVVADAVVVVVVVIVGTATGGSGLDDLVGPDVVDADVVDDAEFGRSFCVMSVRTLRYNLAPSFHSKHHPAGRSSSVQYRMFCSWWKRYGLF